MQSSLPRSWTGVLLYWKSEGKGGEDSSVTPNTLPGHHDPFFLWTQTKAPTILSAIDIPISLYFEESEYISNLGILGFHLGILFFIVVLKGHWFWDSVSSQWRLANCFLKCTATLFPFSYFVVYCYFFLGQLLFIFIFVTLLEWNYQFYIYIFVAMLFFLLY